MSDPTTPKPKVTGTAALGDAYLAAERFMLAVQVLSDAAQRRGDTMHGTRKAGAVRRAAAELAYRCQMLSGGDLLRIKQPGEPR